MFIVFAACDKGYNGVHCKDRCAAPFYGSDCQFECKCEKENCHYAEGCKQTNKTGILFDAKHYLPESTDGRIFDSTQTSMLNITLIL